LFQTWIWRKPPAYGGEIDAMKNKKKLLLLLLEPTAQKRSCVLAQFFGTNNTGVIIHALQTLYFLYREHKNGTVFFVKRPNEDAEVIHFFTTD